MRKTTLAGSCRWGSASRATTTWTAEAGGEPEGEFQLHHRHRRSKREGRLRRPGGNRRPRHELRHLLHMHQWRRRLADRTENPHDGGV